MSYILFSQNSTDNGVRSKWLDTSIGSTAAANTFGIAGNGTAWAAVDAMTAGIFNANGYALFDLDISAIGTGILGADDLNGINVNAFDNLGSGAGGVSGAEVTASFTGDTLSVSMSDVDWNDIKNVEVLIDYRDSDIKSLAIQNFVDGRLKIGAEACFADDASPEVGRGYGVVVTNVKRGEFDGSYADDSVTLSASLYSNSGWDNNYYVTTSRNADSVTITGGDRARMDDVAGAGVDLGREWGTATSTALNDAGVQEFVYGAGAGGAGTTYAYNGTLSTVKAQLGSDDDSFTSEGTVSNGGTDLRDFRSTDWVWGQGDDDRISTGAGNDYLFGDLGSNGNFRAQIATATEYCAGGDNVAAWESVYDLSATYGADGSMAPISTTASAPLNAAAKAAAAGIGVGFGNNNGSGPNNPEINTTNGDAGASDALTIALNKDAASADITLSLFYANDGNTNGRVETAIVELYDNGNLVGTARVAADNSSTDANLVTDGFVPGVGSDAFGNPYNDQNPGLFTFTIVADGGALFDTVVLKSGGLINNAGAEINNGDVSDFYLAELCICVPDLFKAGNDILDGGTGKDWLEGNQDTGSYELCTKGTGNLLDNGGFETVAGDAAQQESGAWYLTDGGVANAIDFGWTVADPATNIEIQMGGTGGLAPFAGNYKLELDSHPLEAANPLVSQAVATCAGGLYVLEFALAERQGAGNGSSDFKLFWDGAVIATFTNPAGSDSWTASGVASGITVTLADVDGTGAWFTAKVTGLAGDGASSVGFQSLNGQTNTFGTFIDAVSLTEVAPVATLTKNGDILYLGNADLDRDVVSYNAGDGVDTVYEFEQGIDKLDINTAYTTSAVVFEGVLSTLIDITADDGALIVKGVSLVGSDFI